MTQTKVQEAGLGIELGAEPYNDLDILFMGLVNLNQALTDLDYEIIMAIEDERVQQEQTVRPYIMVKIPLSQFADQRNRRLIFYKNDESTSNFCKHRQTWSQGIELLFESLRIAGVKEIKSNLAFTITIH